MGYCYYTHLLGKCRKLEDKTRQTNDDFAVDAAGAGCSTNNEEVEENKVCKRVFPLLEHIPSTHLADLQST